MSDWLDEKKDVAIASSAFNELAPFSKIINKDTICSSLLENYNHAQAYVIIRKWAEIFEDAEKELKQKAINSTNSKNTEIFLNGGCVATLCEKSLPKKIEYEDLKLDELYFQFQQLKDKIKERENLLQTIKEPVADAETGELIIPAKIKEAGTTISLKWKG